MVTFGQVVSCYYMFLYYNPVIIKAKVSGQKLEDFEIGALDDFISRNVDAIILASNMFISHLLSTWVHYRLIFGLKKPLMLSCSLVTIVLFMTCIYLHFSEGEFMLIYERNNWIYQTLANLLIIGFELGLSTAPDVMLTDYTPNQVFPRAKLIVKLTQWLLIFIATKTFFQISAQLYGSGAFTIYAVLSLCICIASGIFVVESKGKTLVQVQTDIGGNPIGSRGIYNRKLTISNESPEANEAMLIG